MILRGKRSRIDSRMNYFTIEKNKKKIKQISFDLEKNIEETDFIIKNVRINSDENNQKSSDVYLVKNIQNLRSYIRKIID